MLPYSPRTRGDNEEIRARTTLSDRWLISCHRNKDKLVQVGEIEIHAYDKCHNNNKKDKLYLPVLLTLFQKKICLHIARPSCKA